MKISAEIWNKKYPPGTRVKYFPFHGSEYFKETTTRSEAWNLGNIDTVVKILGNPGSVSLERLQVQGDRECRKCKWIGFNKDMKRVLNIKISKQSGAEVHDYVCPNCGCSVFNVLKQEV